LVANVKLATFRPVGVVRTRGGWPTWPIRKTRFILRMPGLFLAVPRMDQF
jgi:hypothetical protein